MAQFCQFCGNSVDDGAICNCPGATAEREAATQPQQNAPQQPVQPMPQTTADNSKIYKILSYIGILWLVGLFVTPEKNDPKVKFHVGQGMIVSIVGVALWIVIAIINAILGAVFGTHLYGYLLSVPAPLAILETILSLAMWAYWVVMLIVGILNVVHDQEKPLPVIGKLAFYK